MKAGTNVWWQIPWEMFPHVYIFLFVRIFKHLMKAGTNVWWLIQWEMFTHVYIFICQNIQASDEGWYQCVLLIQWEMFTLVNIFICQNIQASDEGWYQCVVANSVGKWLPMYVFLFVRIFKHLMKAGTNVWWLIQWEMFTHVYIFICQNIQASDEGWYQCVLLIQWEMFTLVNIFICQNIQASDEGWYQCVVANSVGKWLPMYVFLFVRIFKHLMKAGTNVWWLIPWEMFQKMHLSKFRVSTLSSAFLVCSMFKKPPWQTGWTQIRLLL